MSMDPDERFICDYQAEVCDYVRQEAESCAGNDVVAGISLPPGNPDGWTSRCG